MLKRESPGGSPGSNDVPAVAAANDTRRIRYPAGRYPVLVLPDGERHAVHSMINATRPMRFGDFLWDDDGIPPGPVWIRVDLGRQIVSVFRGGHEIGSAVILFGTDGKPTPAGMFKVLEKAERHESTLYDAEMPYMLRLTGDGIAIHASRVRAGSATHGCIGVPPEFARRLFEQMKVGGQVAIIAA